MKTGHQRVYWRTAFTFVCLSAAVAIAVAADRTDSTDPAETTNVEFKVHRGAEAFGPFVPQVVNVDVRQLPAAPEWRPGDPIKEIPRRDNRNDDWAPPVVDLLKPANDPLLARQAQAADPDERAFSTPELNFAGQGFSGVNPPDPSGEVGKDYYIQVINSGGGARVAIYNKADGTPAATPFQMDSLGSGSCASGLGDGVVLYDEMASRWLLTEFSSGGNRICMYVSQTADPITGGWFFYQITAPSFPDYPKYGVWPDAYYVSSNESTSAAYAIDRVKMLAGDPATFQRFTVSDQSGFGFQALNPTDHDGSALPPSGTGNYFFRHRDDEVHNGSPDAGAANDWLQFWEFSVDFDVPGNSTLSGPTNIAIAEIDSTLCGLTSFNCFPQPGTGTTLDPLREVVMFPITYRNFGTHQSIVGNLVTDVGVNHGGLRWFELRRTGTGPWSLFQEGTFAPDSDNRFMASNKLDGDGNMAIGYSVTSSSTFPSLRYHGRLAGDPLGTLPGTESVLTVGTASNASNRWGDYSQISLDPEDDCTFWYTMEWNTSSSWRTQIGSFKFDECGEPGFTLNALDADDLEQEICNGDGLADIDLTIGQIQGFTNPVTLATSGAPAGTSASFTTNPVVPPGTSTAQITLPSLAFGQYTINIDGTATGADPRQLVVTVDVFDAVPGAPTLLSPVNGATNVSNANLSWTASNQATGYTVQVATDAGFSNVVESATVSGTSYNVSGLAPDTLHFWRVTPQNECGTGAASATFSFTTSLTICRTPGLPINDNSTTSDTLTIGAGGTLDDLNVSVDLTHTFLGDLRVSLEHVDSSTTVILFDRHCGTGNNMDITFDDEAATFASANCSTGTPAIPPGSYRPTNPLTAFDGDSFDGDWILRVQDLAGGDTGSLNEWCVTPELSGTCGDSVIDPGEDCDDGNTAGGDGCDANCKDEICGNGIVQTAAGEECDDGNTTSGDGCDASCIVEFCGDGTTQPGLGEQCDDSNTTNGDGCDSNCKDEICGNGILQFGEECDDGNTTSNDGCDATCNNEVCGDGILQGPLGEVCDDGNTVGGDGCSADCMSDETCGNGITDPGEECDDGNLVDDDACANDCTSNALPNALVNGDFSGGTPPWVFTTTGAGSYDVVGGEAKLTFTTSGLLVTFHQDDIAVDGNTQYTLSFRARHMLPGRKIDVSFLKQASPFTNYGLQSQPFVLTTAMQDYSVDFTTTSGAITDGRLRFNLVSAAAPGSMLWIDDVVLAETSPAVCGNGNVETGEQCDDGNTANGDGCDSTCQFEPVCGNGTIETGEQCDDGNTANGDGCDSSCQIEPPVCGNGTVETGEQCDDGNTANGDGCSSTCQTEPAVCGNGIVETGEQCDDGNTANGDGCSSTCQSESGPNLVVNGDFAGGTLPWRYTHSNGSSDYSIVGGEAFIDIATPSANGQLWQDGITLQPNTTYRLTFDARNTGGDNVRARVIRHTSPYTQYGSQVTDLTTTMQTHSFVFTTPGSVAEARVQFYIGPYDSANDDYFFDNVILALDSPAVCGNGTVEGGEECDDGNTANGDGCDSTCQNEPVCGNGTVESGEQCDDGNTANGDGCSSTCQTEAPVCGNGTVESGEQCDDGNTANGDGCSSTCQNEGGGPNLLVNGDFSSGTLPWRYTHSNGSSTYSVVGGEAFIDIATPSTNGQLWQNGVTLQPNTTYRVTFRGRNTAGSNVRARVIRHTSPYTQYGSSVVNLTTTMQTYTFTFTTPGSVATARMQLYIGPYDTANGDYYFDDVVLEVE